RGNRHHHIREDGLGALLLRQQGRGNGDGEVLNIVVGRVDYGGDHLGDFDTVGAGGEADLDAIQIVLQPAEALVPVTILQRVQRNIHDVVDVLHHAARALRAG